MSQRGSCLRVRFDIHFSKSGFGNTRPAFSKKAPALHPPRLALNPPITTARPPRSPSVKCDVAISLHRLSRPRVHGGSRTRAGAAARSAGLPSSASSGPSGALSCSVARRRSFCLCASRSICSGIRLYTNSGKCVNILLESRRIVCNLMSGAVVRCL